MIMLLAEISSGFFQQYNAQKREDDEGEHCLWLFLFKLLDYYYEQSRKDPLR